MVSDSGIVKDIDIAVAQGRKMACFSFDCIYGMQLFRLKFSNEIDCLRLPGGETSGYPLAAPTSLHQLQLFTNFV